MISDEAYNKLNCFNSLLKQLITFATKKSLALKTNNVKIRACMAINSMPLIGIESVGPYLERFAEKIKAKDADFFINSDYSDEIEDDDREDIIKLLEMIKNIYVSKCSQDEQKKIFSDIEHMLNLYMEYIDIV